LGLEPSLRSPSGVRGFKGRLYGRLDPRFQDFFRAPLRSSIRLDEVEWGGVAVNGIPPLEYPRHVAVADAGYLHAEWKRVHPDATALSLHTGFTRDYSEGAAYRQYFATDALMLGVSRIDARLAHKAAVLVVRPPSPTGAAPVAMAADFLHRERVYHVDVAARRLVVITSEAGANRVYEVGAHRFTRTERDGRVIDTTGRAWVADEDRLRATFDATLRLPRVPAHRAFWFAWYAQNPDTVLIK
jgi:hypothetical protein